jgi:hypothetical protein
VPPPFAQRLQNLQALQPSAAHAISRVRLNSMVDALVTGVRRI